MSIITPRAACPQARFPTSDPAAQRRAWAMLLASWRRRQAKLAHAAAADAEREIDALLERKIKAARQHVVRARSHTEQAVAWIDMRSLIGARTASQVRDLAERGRA